MTDKRKGQPPTRAHGTSFRPGSCGPVRERRTEAAGDGTAEFATADVLSLHASLTPEMSRQAGAWALGLEGKLTPRRVEDDESRGALVARGRSPVAGLADAEAR